MLRSNRAWTWDDAIIYDGTICSVGEFGVFVEFMNGKEKMEGFVHRADIPNHNPNGDSRSKYKVGEPVRVRILEIKRLDGFDRVKLQGVEFPSK